MVFQGLCGRAVADAPAHIPAAEEAQLLYDAIWRQLQPGMADPRQRGSYPRREWPIRVNVDHILGDEENLSRIPAEIREAQNLPLLLETAVELARRKAVVEPSIVVPQGYQGRVQYLLPICLTDMEQPDLAMTLTIMDGYYLGNTCLTLEMAYLNARLLSRPVAHWLTDIVEE